MSFSEIVGQGRALTLLTRAVLSGKVASGYLFCGPEGVGKASCALSFAMALMCERRDPNESDGCGRCDSCHKVRQRLHPDLHWLAPDGAFLKIDQIRELKGKLSLRPHEAKVKIAVLEEAERMHPTAANALLKVLEEPTADTCFILLAKSPRFVLPTVRSRCQTVPFVPLCPEDIERILLARGAEQEAARIATRLAEGSVGRAVSALESTSEMRQRIERVKQLERAISAQDPMLGLKAAEELAKGTDRQEAMAVLELLALFYRDVACTAAGQEALRAFPEGEERILDRAQELGLKRALACVDATLQARDSLNRFGNALLVLEDMVFSLRQSSRVARAGRGRA